MTQYVINIGNLPNDGTGDPLRTAFNDVNLNFNQVWATGLVNSNIQIANNTILTTNTNGNLVLNPNGVGIVIANAHVIPDQNRVRNLGSSARRWDTVYVQYVDVGGTLTVTGDVSIAGNLSVTGNIVEMGNIITDAKTIQLANTAGTANAANGSGITVGANDNIATFLFSSSANAWTTNIGLKVGNIGFVGDAIYDLNGIYLENADLTHGATAAVILPSNGNTSVPIQVNNTYGNIVLQAGANSDITASWTFNSAGNLILPGNTSSINYANGQPYSNYGNTNVVNLLANFGSNTISTSGNITGGNILGNIQAADGNTSVMFNKEGFLGADAGFSYDYSANTLYVETVNISGKNNQGDEAIYAGVTGFTPLGTSVVAQLAGDATNYTQINFQNINSSPTASGDYIITANNGTDTEHFIDLGIAGNNWDGTQTNSLGTAVKANDGYLYVNGGNLVVGTYLNSGPVNNTWNFGIDGLLVFPSGANTDGRAFNSGAACATMSLNAYNSNSDTVSIQAQGNSSTAVISVYSDATNITNNWRFDSNGDLDFPGGTFAGDDIEGTGNFGFETPANVGFGILTNEGSNEWVFGDNGVLTLAGDITAKSVGFPFTSSITNITTGNPTVVVDIADNVFPAPVTGKVTIQGVLGTTEANEVWYYQAVEVNQFQLFSDAACTVAVDGTAWTAYTGGGMAYAPTYDSMAISTGGLQVVAGPSSWYFGLDGNINTPSNLVIGSGPGGGGSSILQNNAPLQVVGEGANSFVVAGWAETTSAPGNIAVIGFNAPYGNGAANVIINVGDNNATPYNWVFGNDGNLSLPTSGNIVGITANNSGSMQWIGNSSGDGFGYTTLQLRPDDTRTGSDQYLIIDPTAPGHIHIRAGGTQDASGADLFLGGENSYFKVGSGVNPSVAVTANNNSWTFGTDGILTLPAINVSAPAGEAAQFIGTRKIIGGITQTNPYSVALAAGGNATVAYTASTSTVVSVKVTFAVQSSGSGFQWEQFDVVATVSQDSVGDVNFVVSNRVKAAAGIGDTTVTATMNGTNQIEISLNLDPAQNSGGTASFDAVEFGLMID